MSKRHEYIEMLKEQIDEMNAKIDDWQTKREDVEGRVKEEAEEKLVAFREAAAAASTKLREIRDATDDSWEDLKTEMEKVRTALIHSYNYFKSQL